MAAQTELDKILPYVKELAISPVSDSSDVYINIYLDRTRLPRIQEGSYLYEAVDKLNEQFKADGLKFGYRENDRDLIASLYTSCSIEKCREIYPRICEAWLAMKEHQRDQGSPGRP